MKMRFIVLVLVMTSLIFSVNVYAGYKTDANRGTEKVVHTTFKNKKASKKKNVIQNKTGKKIEVKYIETENMTDETVSNQGEIDNLYGVIDVYKDDINNIEYLYQNGTDIPCGMRQINYEIDDSKKRISEKRAIEIAKEYCKQIDVSTSEYEYNNIMYVEWGQYYDVYFVNKINGMDTNDVVRVWVTIDGNVISYSSFMKDSFDDIKVNNLDIEEALVDTQDKINDLIDNQNIDKSSIRIEDQIIKTDGDTVSLQSTLSYEITDGINSIIHTEQIEENISK